MDPLTAGAESLGAELGELERLGTVDAALGMRIAAVRPILLSYEYPPVDVQRWSGGTLPGVTVVLAEVVTEDGATGLGETYVGNFVPEVARALIEYFGRQLVGRDPARIAEAWRTCVSRSLYWGRSGVPVAALSAIDAALWDLCGKALGKPAVELLGGTVHAHLPCYASGGMEASRDELAREREDIVAAGFRAWKIRGGTNPDADAEKIAAARAVLGSGRELAVDAVQGSNPRPWTAREAIAAIRAAETHDLLWYEEPCAAEDVEGHAACRRATNTPIAGGETCTTVRELASFLTAEALDVIQPDAAHVGGLLPGRIVCALAERAGVDVAVHAWLGAGSVMANYHMGFASPACAWLEHPIQPNPFVTEMLVEPLVLRDGCVAAPTAPGLGIRLPDELRERFPYRPGMNYHFEERRQVAEGSR